MASKEQVESWTEEVTCPVCVDFFTDPVSLECGHNFCRSCITWRWDREEEGKVCPQCREEFAGGTLRASRALARLSEKARKLSLNPTGASKKPRCEEHQEELRMFCDTDKKLICVDCATAPGHRDHRFLSIEEAVGFVKAQVISAQESLTGKKSAMEEMAEQQQQEISGVRQQSQSLESHIASQFAELHQILTEKEQRLLRDLREEEERILIKMETNLRAIQESLNSIHVELSKLQKQMNQKENAMFLQEEAYQERSMNDEVQTASVIDGAPLVKTFDKPLLYTLWRGMFDALKQVSLTLDVETANPRLDVSEDLKKVRWIWKYKKLSDTWKRFKTLPCVLGSEQFTSGRHYWEVEVEGNPRWSVGVAAESAERKKKKVKLSPENGFWSIGRWKDDFLVNNSSRSPLFVHSMPKKVAVYLSYESGTVSFYSVDTKSHLHTFTGNKFVGKMYPFFWTWGGKWLRIGSSSAPNL